jgi:hypothetical protein
MLYGAEADSGCSVRLALIKKIGLLRTAQRNSHIPGKCKIVAAAIDTGSAESTALLGRPFSNNVKQAFWDYGDKWERFQTGIIKYRLREYNPAQTISDAPGLRPSCRSMRSSILHFCQTRRLRCWI